jgi:hypothetical protein
LAQVQALTGIDIRKSIEPALSLFTLNGQSPILADSAVRKAVLEGIDRQQLQKIQFQGLNLTAPLPGSMLLLPFQGGYQDNFTKVITFNPQQAKQDLEAAGWIPGPDGIRVKDAKPLEFTYVNLGDDPVDKAVAAATAAMLHHIGVRLTIRQVPSNESSAIVTGKRFDMFYSGITQSDPYGIAYLCQFYCSNTTLIHSGVNSPALDAQLRAVNTLPTPQQQYAKANELETEAFTTYGIMPTTSRPALLGVLVADDVDYPPLGVARCSGCIKGEQQHLSLSWRIVLGLIVNRTQYGRGQASSCYGPNSVAGSSELCPRLLLCSHYLNAQQPGVVVSHRIDVIGLTFREFERAPFWAVPAKGDSEHGADVCAVVLVMR